MRITFFLALARALLFFSLLGKRKAMTGVEKIFEDAKAIITGSHFVYAKKAGGFWYHGDSYVNKDAIYPFVKKVSDLCSEIAKNFFTDNSRYDIDTVVGPTVGAVSLAQWTAYWLNRLYGEEISLAVCADEEDIVEEMEFLCEIPEACPKDPPIILEFQASGQVKINTAAFNGYLSLRKIKYFCKTGTRRVIKRGYDQHVKGKICLIVEDVINSGLTVAKTRDAIIAAGGKVVGVGALCNRSGGKVTAQTLCVPELFSLLNVNMKMFKEDECPICAKDGPKSVRTDLGRGKEFLARKGLLR